MIIDIAIPGEELDSVTRITLLEQIAVAAAREAGDGWDEAAMTLMAAVVLVVLGNRGETTDIAEVIPKALEAAYEVLDARKDDQGLTMTPDAEDDRGDLPDWEVMRPEQVLVEPWFRNGRPDWISEVQEIINEGRAASKRKLPTKTLSESDVRALQTIVARYIKSRVDWQGWLNKGDASRLKRVRDAATRLAKALEALRSDGKGRPTDRYLEAMLAESGEGWSTESILEPLKFLSGFEIRSPILAEATSSPAVFKSPTEEGARATLQGKIDAWWETVAELSKAKEETKSPAYHAFLKEVFGRIPLSDPPGHSEGAIAEARQEYNSRERERREQAEAMAKAFADLGRTPP